jgi:signal transduction histidine kinase
MTRLFRRFFIIIWLTMAGSVATAFAVNSLLRSSPFVEELKEQQRVDLMQLTAAILQREGVEAARKFAQAAAVVRPEMPLSIAEVSLSTQCASLHGNSAIRVALGTTCYHLSTEIPRSNAVASNILKLLPWITALCASIVSAFWLTRYLIGPVDYLRHGLSGLANGRFDIRIGDKIDSRRDEVASLVNDFDTTAARLETLKATQQRLFHDVSHELRSPLSRLQAALGVLRQSPKKLEPMVERMEREIDRMDQLVEEILTLARLNSGALNDFERQAIDMIDLLTEMPTTPPSKREAGGSLSNPIFPGALSRR